MPHGRKKPHGLRNAVIVAVALMVILSLVVVAYRMSSGGRVGPPTYSSVSISSTVAGSSCTFSTLWADEANVSGYIFETNNTGTLVNDSWTPFSDFVSSRSSNATVTETLDNTIGDLVEWRFWCNDTSDNWNSIPMQSFFVDTDYVLLVTSMGNITIQLYDDMPITTGNFKNLVRTGAYDGTTFSRVAKGFVIQGGDVSSKGITWPTIPDELPNKHSNVRGAVAMAKTSQPNSASDQFFIDLNDSNANPNGANLDKTYSVFGMVVAGMDVVDNISQVAITPVNSATDGTPVQPIYIQSVQFVRSA
jgi:cyclophilin family peptidyl-prolyl cis-trans isomerase